MEQLDRFIANINYGNKKNSEGYSSHFNAACDALDFIMSKRSGSA
jgi:hypothetical protein